MNLTPGKYEQALAYLTINCSFLGDLSLFHGRMGIILFFAHYARATQSKHYEDFAGYLLDELYEEIHEDLPVNLENGLCGIGWGIEYLVQQGFMEGNTDEILADIDRKVMEIDPLRMTDLSFRRGLAGIAFYVIARLNAHRETSSLPFDDAYLHALQKALERAEFAEKDRMPIKVHNIFDKKNLNIKISIPDCLLNKQIPTFDVLGLENGLSGALLYGCKQQRIASFPSTTTNNIVLFEERCRAGKYGIGTYMSNIYHWLLSKKQRNIYVVYLRSSSNCLKKEQKDQITYIHIPYPSLPENIVDWQEQMKRYYKSVVLILGMYIPKASLFYLNYMHMEYLARELKKNFPLSLNLLTVHYTSWSLELLGNKFALQNILNKNLDENNNYIYENILSERRLLYSCDYIVAIAQHSYNDLCNTYSVPQSKLHLIPHGLIDKYDDIVKHTRTYYRKKYGLRNDDIIVIFAGRIDAIKGVKILSKAISKLKKYHKLHFIISGSGDYNLMFNESNNNWSNVSFTGFVSKNTLYELFYLSDIGVVPSIHEEFGYVALEMMMMGLPIIGGNTSGLSEIIKNQKTGILLTLSEQNIEESSILLKDTIIDLMTDSIKRQDFSIQSRKHFKECFAFEKFENNMNALLESIDHKNVNL